LKYETIKKQREQQNTAINLLSNITNVTSGQLALNNCWTLGPQVLAKVIEKDNNDKNKQKKIDENKQLRATKQGNRFKLSYQKFMNNHKLLATDMTNLLRKVRQPNDSPLRSKAHELQQQWEKRKHRFEDFLVNVPTPVGDGIISSPTTTAHVPVATVREQLQNNINFVPVERDGSELLFLDMVRRINSSTDHIHTSSI
jgi:mRNA-degrading endonuclease YafQ of YafQ-DinJ toxin-antitoxin module